MQFEWEGRDAFQGHCIDSQVTEEKIDVEGKKHAQRNGLSQTEVPLIISSGYSQRTLTRSCKTYPVAELASMNYLASVTVKSY